MQTVTNFKNTNNINIVIENILNNIIESVNRSNHSSGYYLRMIDRVNYDNEDENCDDIKDLDYDEDENINDLTYKFDSQISSRPQRFQRVDYSDMMLNDEDEDDYDVSIRKRRFENGKVVYNCEKIKASQINAKFDDDYVVENDDDDLENMLSNADVDDPNDEDYVYESAGEDEFDDDFNDDEEDSDDDASQEDEEESDNENEIDEDYVYESDEDDELDDEEESDNENDDPKDEDYVYESDEDEELDDDFDEEEESDDEASEEDDEEDHEDYDDDEDYVYESDEEDELEYNYDFIYKKPMFSRAIRAN